MSINKGSQAANITRWTARGLSVLSIAILLLFLFGEGDFSQPLLLSAREWVGIALFPVGVIIGMIVGWWREGAGAAITTLSLLAFYALDILFTGTPPGGPFFLLFSLPGILFGASWLLRRRGS